MFVLITGGAASGKSEFAENLCAGLAEKLGAGIAENLDAGLAENLNANPAENRSKLYVATMEPFGEEAEYRIMRHREMRKKKGFDTLEKYRDLHESIVDARGYHTILVECMSTLLANEIFTNENYHNNIVEGIAALRSLSMNLILITNRIFSDGAIYDDSVMEYMTAFSKLNKYFAAEADAVIEIVCGIPVLLKGDCRINEYF